MFYDILFYFIIITIFFPQSCSWPSLLHTLLSLIFFLLWWFNDLEHYILLLLVIYYFSFFLFSLHLYYLFITATYCQFISIYYLINHYLLICSLITSKIYLVYTIISIFCYSWSNYVSPHKLEKKLLNFSNRCHALWYRVSIWLFCIWLLAILCLIVSSLLTSHFAITLRVLKPVLCFQMTSNNYGAKGLRDVDPACRCHQSNIMFDSIFSVNIAQCVT